MNRAILTGVASALILAACAGARTFYTAEQPRTRGYSLAFATPPRSTAPNIFVVGQKIVIDQEPIRPPGNRAGRPYHHLLRAPGRWRLFVQESRGRDPAASGLLQPGHGDQVLVQVPVSAASPGHGLQVRGPAQERQDRGQPPRSRSDDLELVWIPTTGRKPNGTEGHRVIHRRRLFARSVRPAAARAGSGRAPVQQRRLQGRRDGREQRLRERGEHQSLSRPTAGTQRQFSQHRVDRAGGLHLGGPAGRDHFAATGRFHRSSRHRQWTEYTCTHSNPEQVPTDHEYDVHLQKNGTPCAVKDPTIRNGS